MDHADITPAARAAYERINVDNWTTLAVLPNKRPFGDWGKRGDKNRFDYQNVEELLGRYAHADAFGVVTGASGLVIIDLDNEDAIRRWADLFGIPLTRIVKTPRGRHLYYQAPDDLDLSQITDLHAGVDIRAGNSYAIMPPSKTAGGDYTWANDLPIAPLPTNVRAFLEQHLAKPEPHYEIGEGERIKEGARNDTGFHYALKLVRAGLPRDVVIIMLTAFLAERADGDLAETEIFGMVDGAIKHAKNNPPKDQH